MTKIYDDLKFRIYNSDDFDYHFMAADCIEEFTFIYRDVGFRRGKPITVFSVIDISTNFEDIEIDIESNENIKLEESIQKLKDDEKRKLLKFARKEYKKSHKALLEDSLLTNT